MQRLVRPLAGAGVGVEVTHLGRRGVDVERAAVGVVGRQPVDGQGELHALMDVVIVVVAEQRGLYAAVRQQVADEGHDLALGKAERTDVGRSGVDAKRTIPDHNAVIRPAAEATPFDLLHASVVSLKQLPVVERIVSRGEG